MAVSSPSDMQTPIAAEAPSGHCERNRYIALPKHAREELPEANDAVAMTTANYLGPTAALEHGCELRV